MVDEMQLALKSIKDQPDTTLIRAAGSILHDFYTGLEKIFERIAYAVDGGLPEGEGWHTQILRRMLANVPNRRPAVLSVELGENLNEYLSFRHLFRHIYGFELKWQRCQNLAENLPALYKEVDLQLKAFINFLSKL
ncbi:hypothetical protein A2291_03020 [candidate division WOR-1 bacterium RIFOXYB2_FULL_42_35]|uniref:HepT-like domain-containing protein n=1 Tax=candidate division WOR-1 bacterium RIFOXYC2_FULL_41_25 TaxID=1802586 RepID=A0A1F4TQY6_UNCSA|nr:MAG: hypothetical protein A2247_01330 [candidate division WOR-1 bacterium RIFOXYA2_FULL_41_14]OGC25740.1 MAG: hypothetical protein A2291_03020 [candidate division WOR-1 bacterium RIFOXYB2_FULL_42_35]OGC35142.1 MAG: hypothetical protein A2462_06165 [candidate division WOR-1 bacterium RIFOXYC2_FULL_41_25]OGC42208.1 MAG: hypothetical protein A2548_03610 [candidate division WOR-1 bacterium RIFOXYD2_FULL_41_8]